MNIKAIQESLKPRGFALVVTVSLLILLTLIAVGLLTLSSISLRSSASSSAMAEARANARLAMMMAVGQLQALGGLDTRVTASSSLVSDSNVPVTGVWRSWEGSDRDNTGKPIAPDYRSKNQPGDPSLELEASGGGRFLGWLTSTAMNVNPDTGSIPDVAKAGSANLIAMVSKGSVDDANQEVHMKATPIDGGKGALAWWTSGDNAKALVNADRADDPSSLAAWHQRVRSNGRADAKTFGLEKVDDFSKEQQLPTSASLQLIDRKVRRIHDLTAFNRGLLTNTATGGWRRDLSLLAERYQSMPSGGLPSLTVKPGRVQTFSKAQPSAHPPNALIYPWANYRSSPSSSGWSQVPPICSWDALVDYAQQWRNLNSSSASRTSMPSFIFSHGASGDRYNFQDKVRRCPQIARIHWIYSLCSVIANATNEPDASKHGQYKPALMVTPVLTLWNPYNVQLSISSFGVNIQETAPLRFKFRVGTQSYPETSLSEISKAGTGYQRFNLKINSAITLNPGATRIYGLNDPTPKDNSRANDVVLTEGYRPGGGFLFFGLNKGQNVYAPGASAFVVEKISYDAQTTEGSNSGQKSGFGIIYDIIVDGGSKSAHRMIYETNELGGPTVVNQLYPPLTRTISTTVSEVQGSKNRPFASAIFGYRMASPPSRDPKHRHLFSKGMLQANPLCFYTEIGFGDDNNAITSMAGTGVYHPINAPYDFAFQDVEGWNDTMAIPQFDASSKSSYIVSGLSAGDGLTRCVMAELPTRPLQSLAELQHFDARNNNPIPPFQFNLIGNGSANPIFAPDQVSVKTTYNNGMCNDDTYLLNQLLFDDWFVSSISPDLRDFSPSSKRTVQKVYEDHLRVITPLPNRFYLPAPGADLPTPSQAASAITSVGKDKATGMYPYETIASKLEVQGMFNINSVSLDAWKAILRQGRDMQVPWLSPNGATNNGNATSFSFPRTSIAGDQGTDSGSNASNPLFPGAVEFAGHRVLTDAQIDALAEEIVKEIRGRGPFLSLAEFVNRRLSNEKDLAIAGTIQKALDNLANSGGSSKNPFAALQSMAVNITAPPPGVTDYKFPEAAMGSSAFGVPGWIRQADILRPLAPMISARDDTFTIRAYGDARDKANKSRILARAWCEVVVKRGASYVDPSDDRALIPFSTQMKSSANKRFGRAFEIVSFRWLDEREI